MYRLVGEALWVTGLSLDRISGHFGIDHSALCETVGRNHLSQDSSGLFSMSRMVHYFNRPAGGGRAGRVLPPPGSSTSLHRLMSFVGGRVRTCGSHRRHCLSRVSHFRLLVKRGRGARNLSRRAGLGRPGSTPRSGGDSVPVDRVGGRIRRGKASRRAGVERPGSTPRRGSVARCRAFRGRPGGHNLFKQMLGTIFGRS